MKRFFELLQNHKRIELPTGAWDEKIGANLRAALVAEGVFEPAPRTTRWSCDGGMGEGCPRRIHVGSRRDGAAWIAQCPSGECGDVKLTDADVQQLGWSFERFVDLLRARLAIAGRGAAPAVSPGTYAIGTIERPDDRIADVLLAFDASTKVFEHFLATRSSRATIVLVASGASDAMLAAHSPSARVELVRLDDLLALRDGRIAVRGGRTLTVAPASRRDDLATALPYVAITREGAHGLSQAEYEALVARKDEFDLFLDASAATKAAGRRKGRCCVSRRGPDRRVHQGELTEDLALAFVELMERKERAIEPRALPSLAISSSSKRAAMKRLQRARELVGEAAFPHDPATSGDALAYRFDPPPCLRFVAIRRRRPDQKSA